MREIFELRYKAQTYGSSVGAIFLEDYAYGRLEFYVGEHPSRVPILDLDDLVDGMNRATLPARSGKWPAYLRYVIAPSHAHR